MNILLLLILLAFEPPSSQGVQIRIIHHRFDRAYSDTTYTECLFVNRIDPKYTWIVYKDREQRYDNQFYTIERNE